MSQKKPPTTDLGTILRHRDASIELHKFLLGPFEDSRHTEIATDGEVFDVDVIELDPAPSIPPAPPPARPATRT